MITIAVLELNSNLSKLLENESNTILLVSNGACWKSRRLHAAGRELRDRAIQRRGVGPVAPAQGYSCKPLTDPSLA